MLKPNVPLKEFEKYGFKKCKAPYSECYYLCVSAGSKMVFLSTVMFDIMDWDDNDPRIHKHPNCRYRDQRTAIDILYELINDGLIIN